MLVLLQAGVPLSETLPGSSGTPFSLRFLAGPDGFDFSILSCLLIDIEHTFTEYWRGRTQSGVRSPKTRDARGWGGGRQLVEQAVTAYGAALEADPRALAPAVGAHSEQPEERAQE